MSWSSPSRRRKPSAERTRRLRRDESKLGLASCIQKSECVPQPVTMWLRVASRLSKCPSEQRLGVYANASSSSGCAQARDPPNPAVPNDPGPPSGHQPLGKRKPKPTAFSTPMTASRPRHSSRRARLRPRCDKHRKPSMDPIVEANTGANDLALEMPLPDGSSAHLMSRRLMSAGVRRGEIQFTTRAAYGPLSASLDRSAPMSGSRAGLLGPPDLRASQ